jgi:hypothetical protein
MKMKNPTVKQVAFVIDKLKLVREQACEEGALDMAALNVYDEEYEYECGTVHCVGGWYAVANLDREFIDNKIKNGRVEYDDGAELMAHDLGFDSYWALGGWAFDNPKIWGNEGGFEMFESASAYDNAGFDGVIAQWELVKQNLIELEK